MRNVMNQTVHVLVFVFDDDDNDEIITTANHMCPPYARQYIHHLSQVFEKKCKCPILGTELCMILKKPKGEIKLCVL